MARTWGIWLEIHWETAQIAVARLCGMELFPGAAVYARTPKGGIQMTIVESAAHSSRQAYRTSSAPSLTLSVRAATPSRLPASAGIGAKSGSPRPAQLNYRSRLFIRRSTRFSAGSSWRTATADSTAPMCGRRSGISAPPLPRRRSTLSRHTTTTLGPSFAARTRPRSASSRKRTAP